MSERNPSFHLILGPMRSGKTITAMRFAQRARSLGEIMVITSTKDTRGQDKSIESHIGYVLDAYKVDVLRDVLSCHVQAFEKAKTIIIDEAQFFDNFFYEDNIRNGELVWFVGFCMRLGKDCVVAGLDSKATQEHFMDLNNLIPLCTSVEKLSAVCMMCRNGTPSSYTIDTTMRLPKNGIRSGNEGYYSVCYTHMREHIKKVDSVSNNH
jgi:thymidine kinase